MGHREEQIQRAVSALAHNAHIKICRQARLYETEPVGREDQPWFLNTVIEIETDLTPRELLTVCKQIERALGRQEHGRYGPREIDLDILLYDDIVVNEPELQIPHAQLPQRRFVLVPLAELAPEHVHPILRKTIRELLRDLTDPKEVRPYGHRDSHRDSCSGDTYRASRRRTPHGDSL